MADAPYIADLFAPPARGVLTTLASDNFGSRNFASAENPGHLTLLEIAPEPLLPVAETSLAHDFAVQQHAPATRKAYRSDFAVFAAWCSDRGLSPIPAPPDAICAFIADEATMGTKVSTITRRIAAIRYAHALRGIDPLPTSSEAVKGHHERYSADHGLSATP